MVRGLLSYIFVGYSGLIWLYKGLSVLFCSMNLSALAAAFIHGYTRSQRTITLFTS